jgi:hypothetical protein
MRSQQIEIRKDVEEGANNFENTLQLQKVE